MLCVAVMLSVMVMGAGAAFSDQDKIENTEAVDACSVLNIIGGYPDGSYKPEGNIKRSEITKMICVALNGGEEPTLGTPATPTFSDVRNTPNAAWAEKYIESCVSQGIVSGVGGGRFSPNGNVTGSQLAKMLLVCLGFDSDIEGYTGNAWDMNVNVRATQKGLYKGLEGLDVSAALTRDTAAQMVWNALQAGEV
ncbi:S-layer homology domain-containing protein, partial [Evtepia gabavorous]|uniref:S-layer homology domain-containing protein n=1 Tax=Evtepia gabavorous TaxID=2211183 RepID=UPI003A8CFF03